MHETINEIRYKFLVALFFVLLKISAKQEN